MKVLSELLTYITSITMQKNWQNILTLNSSAPARRSYHLDSYVTGPIFKVTNLLYCVNSSACIHIRLKGENACYKRSEHYTLSYRWYIMVLIRKLQNHPYKGH